jgi:menaquinone-dependent protoporphyrinogen oxidase
MSVLIAYASAHGSTAEIAERIGGRLRESGLPIDLQPVNRDDLDPGRYDAVVIGSAIHDQAWLPEATVFVDSSLDALASRPVWLFSVGMPGALAGPWRDVAKKEEAVVVAGFRDAVGPREHRLFSGVVRRDDLPRKGRIAFKALGGRYGDFRDWGEIESWADGIARELAPEASD